MSGSWFPTWVLVVMTLVYAVGFVTHAVHALSQRGAALAWTGAHLLMAAGMLVMALPTRRMLVSGPPVVLLYAAAACGCLAVALTKFARGGGAGLWSTAGVGLGAMGYMFAPVSVQNLGVSLVLAVAVGVESAYWASGYFAEVAERDGLVCHPDDGGDLVDQPLPDSDAQSVLVAVVPPRTRALPVRWPPVAGLARPVPMRLSMALMALGMAYMLFGMAMAGAGSSGGGSMPGMSM